DAQTGKSIRRSPAATLRGVHLELGGKAPVVVFDDADLASSVEWIKSAGYFNSGQDCTAATRVLAGPRIYDQLLSALVPAVEAMKVGDPFGDDTELGSVVSQEQLDWVAGFVELVWQGGAEDSSGGVARGGRGLF